MFRIETHARADKTRSRTHDSINELEAWVRKNIFQLRCSVRCNPPKPAHSLFDDHSHVNVFIYFSMTLIYLNSPARSHFFVFAFFEAAPPRDKFEFFSKVNYYPTEMEMWKVFQIRYRTLIRSPHGRDERAQKCNCSFSKEVNRQRSARKLTIQFGNLYFYVINPIVSEAQHKAWPVCVFFGFSAIDFPRLIVIHRFDNIAEAFVPRRAVSVRFVVVY